MNELLDGTVVQALRAMARSGARPSEVIAAIGVLAGWAPQDRRLLRLLYLQEAFRLDLKSAMISDGLVAGLQVFDEALERDHRELADAIERMRSTWDVVAPTGDDE